MIEPSDNSREFRQPWTDETVQRFWTYEGKRGGGADRFFSYHYGPTLLTIAKGLGMLQGRILDYGAAHGLLVKQLLDQTEAEIEALEFGQQSVHTLNEQFQQHTRWRGARDASQPLSESGIADTAFCCEVVEHLTNEQFDATLNQIFDQLKPGGQLLLTTPHAEDLMKSVVYCPFCESEFHNMQHVRSVQRQDLINRLTRSGYDIEFCDSVEFDKLAMCLKRRPWRDWSINYLLRLARFSWLRMTTFGVPQKGSTSLQWIADSAGPNLIAIARKPTDSP